jgi:competence protein ComEA
MDLLKNWFQSLTSPQRTKLGFAVVGLFAVAFWLMSQQDSVTEVERYEEDPVSVSGSVQVHVVGEVAQAGLYELALGSRVQDAIAAAGGFSDKAVQHSVNLARVLSDGEQLVVLGPDDMVSGEAGGLISLNRANESQLDDLPGVGPALAARILEYRQSVGSFSDIRQLREIRGIGEKLFAQIKDLVTL